MRLDREHAHALDSADPLAAWHDRFILPRDQQDGREVVYLCGHSLGAQPVLAADYVEEVMRDWRSLGVEGHFAGRHPWMSYHERLAPPLAELVGAAPDEVVAMNTLTVNLNLLLASFYRPSGSRTALLIERNAFPSDRYAAESHVRWHGLDPARDLIEVAPRQGESLLRTEELVATLERDGPRIATVVLPGVQYLTGQKLDVEAVTAAGRRAGCTVGWDLAHAIGNVPVALHAAGADFAVWCHYKYLNGGPGAVAGAFVHGRHAHDASLPRLAGWWGHDKAARFMMGPEFRPLPGAEGWQNSNPPILAMAPVAASLEHFAAVGLAALRSKSIALTGYFERLVQARLAGRVEIVTPADPDARGAALSLRLLGLTRDRARAVFDGVRRRLIVPDWREPDVIRAAPVPFYNRYDDVWRFVDALHAEL
ncbi:MAG TPA: kynureninase [Steroidobacteraceae bacterium]|nr:kynureninase [Steroidobacteraceae bacterium]